MTTTFVAFFGRLALDGHFVCTLTQLTPGTKNAKPLHPNARRPTLASRILIHTHGLSSNNEWWQCVNVHELKDSRTTISSNLRTRVPGSMKTWVKELDLSTLFVITILQQIRQIGNAVPVPLALALGKELGAALIQAWREEVEKKQNKGEAEWEGSQMREMMTTHIQILERLEYLARTELNIWRRSLEDDFRQGGRRWI